jgi:hypothetical protein
VIVLVEWQPQSSQAEQEKIGPGKEKQRVAKSSRSIKVYLEVGKKRVLAGAIDWPGWCRGARDEAAVLQALIDYAPRYERIMQAADIDFKVPTDVKALAVAERLDGNATTDFGVPDKRPSSDSAPVPAAELRRLEEVLKACWAALDETAQFAHGRELRKGPRGGGRDVDGVVQHVTGAEAGYLSSLGGKLPREMVGDISDLRDPSIGERRQIILDTLGASARGELPERGPRGGVHWTARYFVRRAAWHILDHVWEIEDRLI